MYYTSQVTPTPSILLNCLMLSFRFSSARGSHYQQHIAIQQHQPSFSLSATGNYFHTTFHSSYLPAITVWLNIFPEQYRDIFFFDRHSSLMLLLLLSVVKFNTTTSCDILSIYLCIGHYLDTLRLHQNLHVLQLLISDILHHTAVQLGTNCHNRIGDQALSIFMVHRLMIQQESLSP